VTTSDILLIDTNLLFILLVGEADSSQVGKVPKTGGYTPNSYKLLRDYTEPYRRLVITPNILTEVSNLANKLHHGPLRENVFRLLAAMPVAHPETYVPSREAVDVPAYAWLGLTDSVILIAGRLAASVLTTDGPLCEALWRAGITAVNFTHIRNQEGDLLS
jgi:hypothetical protein